MTIIKESKLYLVTAWASEQRLVLGQVKVEDHSNEITAIPALLELLDISGAIITIDAMGTQMVGMGAISNMGSDGSSLGTRAERVGYQYSTLGENVAQGQTLPHKH